MSKIKLTESQLSNVIKETLSRLKESTRDDLYKSQIEKEFPGALNNYDGKMSYDQYYLELTNNKKEQDKLQRRTDSKNKTVERNAQYKAEYDERDKEIKKQNVVAKKKELISQFVDFLPTNLPQRIKAEEKASKLGYDTIFYMIVGDYMGKFSEFDDENRNKTFNLLSKLINGDYEDYFFGEIDAKYGAHVIEW